jgi:hypothetical protein
MLDLLGKLLEARGGIEPPSKGFADLYAGALSLVVAPSFSKRSDCGPVLGQFVLREQHQNQEGGWA